MGTHFIGSTLFLVTLGFWIVGMGLAGFADMKSLHKALFFVGVGLVTPFAYLMVIEDYFAAAIVGVALFAFFQAGLSGFWDDYDHKTSAQILAYTGVLLVVSAIYAFQALAFPYIGSWLLISGLILFLIPLSIYDVMPEVCAYGVLGLSVINTVLSYMIWLKITL